ncbi:MAG: thiamine-phosphate kinase [Candidatus Omnitrophica bacterium]|nr:thiamine-phosphate kinase [Candidatus Omnitrophota bacterium]
MNKTVKTKFTEDAWIAWLKRKLRPGRGVMRSVGDDCAVIKTASAESFLVTSDMVIEGTHFLLSDATAREIGHKAMAVSLSDIAAMAGIPRWATASVGIPGHMSRKFLTDLFYGLTTVLEKYGGVLVGGDTNRSEKLVIDVTLIGEAPGGSFLGRDTARPGDLLLVTGRLGGSGSAGRHLRFTPRIKEAQFIRRYLAPTAMIDLSDGLAQDLKRLCDESGTGALLYQEEIPLRRGCTVDNGLYDGEDFELLCAIEPGALSEKQRTRFKKEYNIPLTVIGRMREKKEGIFLEDAAGQKKRVSHAKAFQHFGLS